MAAASADELLDRAKRLFTTDRPASVRAARECLDLARAEGNSRIACQSLNLLAEDVFPRDRNSAVEFAREGLELARGCSRSDAAARALSILADAEMVEGRLESAQPLLLEAVQCSKAAGDIRAEAVAVNALGALAWRRAEFDLAINWFKTALELRERLEDDYDIAVACQNLGQMYSEKGDLVPALELSQRSLAIRERIADHAGIGEVSINLGCIYRDLGDWEKALESYFRALAEHEVARDTVNQAICYCNIGEAYLRRGRLERARSSLEKSLDLARQSRARREEADALGSLGETAFTAGDIARALDCYEQDQRICEEIEGWAELAETLRRWAELDLYQNDPAAARAKLERALELCRRCGAPLEEGNVQRVLGQALAAAGDEPAARIALETSRALLKGLGKNYELGLTLLALGQLESRAGEGGRHSLGQALAIFETLGINSRATEAEQLLGGRLSAAPAAGIVSELAELVTTEPAVDRLCRRALKLLARHLPIAGATIVLRDGRVVHEGAAEPRGDGGTSLALESGAGRVGTLVVRGEVDPEELRTVLRLLALGIGQLLQVQTGATAAETPAQPRFPGIIGADTTLRAVYETVERAAPTRANVLVLGETGTGKELVAQAIHRSSDRRDRPLITVNCAAIPEALLEAELFGIEKGTATGVAGREGKLEAAHTGSLFLDEIGDMSLTLQAKMLRALQEQTFERVGGRKPINVDIRVIAATNRDLKTAIAEGRFRQDLYYRLGVVTIALPPLRQRLQDLPAFVAHYVGRFAREYGKPVRGVTDDCMDRLLHWTWPGNVRELVNVIERAVILARGELVQAGDLPADLQPPESTKVGLKGIRSEARARAVAEAELAPLVAALEQTNWNVSAAADKLGVSRVQVYRIMRRHGLRRPRN